MTAAYSTCQVQMKTKDEVILDLKCVLHPLRMKKVGHLNEWDDHIPPTIPQRVWQVIPLIVWERQVDEVENQGVGETKGVRKELALALVNRLKVKGGKMFGKMSDMTKMVAVAENRPLLVWQN